MNLSKESVKSYWQEQWQWLVLIPVLAGYVLFSSSFNYFSQSPDFIKWLSPDETANYTVAKLYAETRNLTFLEKYNLISKDIIHPRSFRSDYGWIKPVSFLGLPLLYGQLAAIFGLKILPYLTPLIGMIGLVFFFLCVKRIFGKDNALISTILAAAFPIYTYYSARSMFHNVLFLSAFLMGLYFALRMVEYKPEIKSHFKKHVLGYFLALCAGLGFGLATITRTSELLWMGPLFIFIWLFNLRQVGIIRLFFFAYGIFMALFPVLYWNYFLYGSFLASGYPELNSSIFSLQQGGVNLANTSLAGRFAELRPIVANIKATIFHFGYKPWPAYKLFNAYLNTMFPWLYWSASAGLLFFLALYKKYSKAQWLFVIAWLAVSLFLVLYYGSWTFYDNPNPNSFSIGNSYTRYWLPLYLGALPLASLALITVTKIFKNNTVAWGLRFMAVLLVVVISVQFVWYEPEEGLAISIEKQTAAKTEWAQILSLTENNSVIITRFSDKLLFPERKVVIGLFDDPRMIAEYAQIVKRLPTYYYNFSFQEADLAYLNSGVLMQASLNLKLVKPITERFSLYKLDKNIIEETIK